MVSEPRRVGAPNELFQAAQVLAVQRFSRAKIHGDAVLDHAIALEDLVQDLKLPAALKHVIFRDDFKPLDNRLLVKNMVVMSNAPPDSYAYVFVFGHAICGPKVDKQRGDS